MQAQDCSYVFEYRDPTTGRVMFVGKSKGWGAWDHIQHALKGSVVSKPYRPLTLYLRRQIEVGVRPESLAPKIVGCFPSQKAIKDEVDRRLTAYGMANLLNSGDHRVTGVDPLEDAAGSVCCIGNSCLYVRESADLIKRSARQFGHFGQCIPNEYLGTLRGGASFRHYPILVNADVNRKTKERAEREYSEDLNCSIEQFYLTFAAMEIAANLTASQAGQERNVEHAKLLAGFIWTITGNDFFVIEQDSKGHLLNVHPVSLPSGEFILAESVFTTAGNKLSTANEVERKNIFLELDNGTAAQAIGGTNAYANIKIGPKIDFKPFVPNQGTSTPAPPLPNPASPAEYNPALTDALQRMTDGFLRRQDYTPPPLKDITTKVESPDLINALARFEALVTSNPVIHKDARQPDIDPTIKDQMDRVAHIRATLYRNRPWKSRSARPAHRGLTTAHAGKRVGCGQYRILLRTR
jgi:hypothetical protein